MMLRATQIWALICFFLVLQLATAKSFQTLRPRDDSSIVPGQDPSLQPGGTPTHVPSPTPTPSQGSHNNNDANDSKAGIESSATATPSSPTSTTSTANARETTLFNGTYSTIPEGQLPLKPTVTPGWAVAGVIMILTGLVYTLIGIKNRWVHSFFSVAYIVSLGIAVLIVYVMSVPVTNAAQGGYVVAAVLAGCALGAASTFFKELTEGLGCALGGFCISMWLLCLMPGGLLKAAAAKAIFIGAFTLVSFGFYFSRWTRDWAMIGLMSFSGATSITLGIDCFSRSGLKEFWVYLWNLNDQLFPFGANTYPVTRGIRVEAALIVIFFLIGIVSQIKLWRIVRDKREKKAAERAEGQRDLEAEEEHVGRQVQEQTERERAEWEKVYGDGQGTAPQTSHSSSAEIDADEKKLRASLTNSTYTPSKNEGGDADDSTEARNSQEQVDALMSAEAAKEAKLTVRVACDDAAVEDHDGGNDTGEADEKPTEDANGGLRGSESTVSRNKKGSHGQTLSPSPVIVPLPFKVPQDGNNTVITGNGSSVAAFVDEEEIDSASRKGSRGLTKRAGKSPIRDRSLDERESMDDSDEGTRCAVEDHRSSLAATLDGSVSDKDFRSAISQDTDAGKLEKHASHDESDSSTVTAKEMGKSIQVKQKDHETGSKHSDELPKEKQSKAVPGKVEVTDDDSNAGKAEELQKTRSLESKTVADENGSDPAETVPVAASGVARTEEDDLPKHVDQVSKNTPEDPPTEKALPVSLTKDHLPRSYSKVALSYRTNEWAKHLSLADAPEPDEIHIEALAGSSKAGKEVARTVDVEDLQKTAEDDALPRTTMKRSDSQLSRHPHGLKKEMSATSLDIASPRGPAFSQGMRSPGMPRRKSAGLETLAGEIGALAIPEENEEQAGGAMSPKTGETFQRQSSVPGLVSYASTHTLLGQREQWLRNKSQGNLVYQSTVSDEVDVFGPDNDGDSLHNYPMYAAALASDPDEVPLSHRREMMRSTGNLSSVMHSPKPHRSTNGVEASENSQFNSHQPKRISALPTTSAREARLANFRQSVAQDLRASISGVPSAPTALQPSSSINGVDAQRNFMINQMSADAQRREARRREQEQQDARFLNRMRSGDLIEAHREVMRRMQNSAKE